MSRQSTHPYARLSWCRLDKLGKLNALVASCMGEGKFTERDYKYLRLNLFLCLELVNETLLCRVRELESGVSLEEVCSDLVAVFDDQKTHVEEVDRRLRNTTGEKDRKHLLLKVTKELTRFFEIIVDIRSKHNCVFEYNNVHKTMLELNDVLREELRQLRQEVETELMIIVDTLEHNFNEFLKKV